MSVGELSTFASLCTHLYLYIERHFPQFHPKSQWFWGERTCSVTHNSNPIAHTPLEAMGNLE